MSNKRPSGMINKLMGMLAQHRDLTLTVERVPVSRTRYVSVNFDYTRDETLRAQQSARLLEVRKLLKDELISQGWIERSKTVLERQTDDGQWQYLDVGPVQSDHRPSWAISPCEPCRVRQNI